MKKKIVYIDFDGVLNNYNGWKGSNELFEPQNGVMEFLDKLSQSYEIYIFSDIFGSKFSLKFPIGPVLNVISRVNLNFRQGFATDFFRDSLSFF